jgi:RNA polymerase sigma-70 factor (ECF subfamily)
VTDSEFRQVFHSHKDVLYRYAFRMTGSRMGSEDLVQECFLKLWRKPEGFDGARGPVRAFLFGIMRNLVLKSFRDERPYQELDPESFTCAPLDLGSMERADAVARSIKLLPPLQREAVVLAEYEEMTLEEIARATQTELAAVKSRLHRGRENLRRMLAPLLEPRGAVYGPK